MRSIPLHVSDGEAVALGASERIVATLTVETPYVDKGGRPYEGDYEVTPSEQAQTLPTEKRLMARDVVVNPIPSNYGLITYDGSTITVS